MEIERGCGPGDCEAIARLLFQGFVELRPVYGSLESLARIMRESLEDPAACVIAREGGEIIGLALLARGGRRMFRPRLRHFVAEYGLLEGLFRGLLRRLLDAGSRGESLYLDMLAVSGERRGKGIGTALLDEVKREAVRLGCPSVKLDVVDENPRARKLYESRGYVALWHRRLPLYRHIYGISGYTLMEMRLSSH